MAAPRMTIGELSRRIGVAPSAIRFYERVGLIRPTGRSASNYRQFNPDVEERLRFIRAAQVSGLALDDVRTLLEFQDGCLSPCADVRALLDLRLKDVDKQLRHLRHVQRTLNAYRRACDRMAQPESCPVLQDLAGKTRRPRTRKS